MPPAKIRALYESDARGALDKDLLEEVAHGLYERCRDIVIVTNASLGRATCPRCDAVLVHVGRAMSKLVCECGFETRWRAYKRTFRDRELWGGRATPFFEAYVDEYSRARNPRDKMLAVDRVVHAMHITLREGRETGRAALNNVIEGSSRDVFDLLEGLAYGPSARALRETKDRWDRVQRPMDR